jgi:hypothetical protein
MGNPRRRSATRKGIRKTGGGRNGRWHGTGETKRPPIAPQLNPVFKVSSRHRSERSFYR